MAAVAAHLDLLAAMGCTVMVFAEGHGSTDGNPTAPLSRRPVLADAAWPEFCAKLNAVARHLRQRGVRLAFHHHMGTVVQTEAEIDRLMAGTERRRRACCSTRGIWSSPAAIRSRWPAATARASCTCIARMSASTVLADVLRDDRSFLRAVLDGVFTVPGDGSIDFAAVLRELRPSGYAGWLVVEAEQDPAKAHPLTYARLGFDNLKRAAEAAGFAVARTESNLRERSRRSRPMIEFCLVGGGFIGPLHAANIAAHPAARLAWVVDLDLAVADKLAAKHGARATANLDAALADPAVGAVMICTPPRTHAAIIERAARAGKAVFCEKPVDLDLARVDACAKVLEATRTSLLRRLQPALRSQPSGAVRRDSRRRHRPARRCWCCRAATRKSRRPTTSRRCPTASSTTR